ncbi:MAG: hypothetical protein ACXWLH_02180 [Candidatus Saccharimonadales bacterium]
MMLQFIVLGLVPGTHLQITFSWFLILGIILDAVFGSLYIYYIFWLRPHKPVKNKKSVAKTAAAN